MYLYEKIIQISWKFYENLVKILLKFRGNEFLDTFISRSYDIFENLGSTKRNFCQQGKINKLISQIYSKYR